MSKFKNTRGIDIKSTIIVMMVGYFCLQPALAQQTSTEKLIEKGDSLRKIDLYNASDSIYLIAKEQAKDENAWQEWYSAVNGLRKNASRQRNYLPIIDSLIKFQKEVPLSETKILGYLNYHTGSMNSKCGRHQTSIKYYKRALPYFKLIKDSIAYCSSINNISTKASRSGDNESALKYTEEGIQFLKNLNNHKYYSRFNILKGQLLLHSDRYLDAIKHFEALLEQSTQDSIYIFNCLAQVHIRNNSLQEAKLYLSRVKNPKGDIERDYFACNSEYYEKADELSLAIQFQSKVLLHTVDDPNLRTHTRELARYSDLLFNAEQFEKAIQYAQLAIYQLRPEIDTNDVYTSPTIIGQPEFHIIKALYTKAKCFERRYSINRETKDRIAAATNYDLMFQMFNNQKQNIYGDQSKYRIGGISQEMYNDAIRFYLETHNKSQQEEDYNKAFRVAQLANSFVLRNSVSEREALYNADVSPDLVNEYLEIRARLAADFDVENKLILKDQLKFDSLTQQIVDKHPGFNSYRSDDIIDVQVLQSKLAPDEILIKYYYFEDFLTVFSISAQIAHHYKIELIEKDRKTIEEFNSAIINTPTSDDSELESSFCENSYSIYKLIFSPIEQKPEFSRKEKIYIIPDGPIKNISFNALLHKESVSWSESSDFLISKYNFRYLYYASQLSGPGKQTTYENNFVGFGLKYQDEYLKEIIENYYENEDTIFTDGNRSASLSVLNHTIAEVQSCAQLLNGIPIVENEATEESIISNVRNSKIAHFAVHALVDKDNFYNSHILLNNSEKDKREFTYQDILNLNFNSELVVLSACQTGIGQNVVGEGLMSLSRAFVQSGGQSSLGTYWNAPDKSTRIIMKLFYQNLKAGESKSEAIRLAQLEYLTNDDISSPAIRAPYYWAGWTLYGKDGIIKLNRSKKFSQALILGIIGCLLLFFIWGLKRISQKS